SLAHPVLTWGRRLPTISADSRKQVLQGSDSLESGFGSRLADGHAGRREMPCRALPPLSRRPIVHAAPLPGADVAVHRTDADHDQLLAARAGHRTALSLLAAADAAGDRIAKNSRRR